MKPITMTFLVTIFLVITPIAAFGLNTPGVIERQGSVTGRYVGNVGYLFGVEYGILTDIAVLADAGANDYSRVGIKFQLNPDMALIGGIVQSKPFVGVNFGRALNEDLIGIAEVDVYNTSSNRLAFDYEAGVKFTLTPQLDLRGGIFGTVTETTTINRYQLGMGFSF